MKRKQLNATQQWMADHPDDKPCPVAGAAAWRRARGLNKAEQIKWLRSRLDADKDPWIVAQTAKLESICEGDRTMMATRTDKENT
jgi:hypothetical protein